jgi:uncharacterized membrane protein YdbT with pleckstrin-like domain
MLLFLMLCYASKPLLYLMTVSAVLPLLAVLPRRLQAAVRGYMSREHQMLTWHTLEGDLEAKQKALAEADKSKVRRCWHSTTGTASSAAACG